MTNYISGQWNAECPRCGFQHKSPYFRKEWTGEYVCKDCVDPRHPQDFIKVGPDKITVPWTNPPEYIFVFRCSFNEQSAVPGQASPGCLIPGYLSPFFSLDTDS